MLRFLIKLKNAILDILFPPLCVNCRRHLSFRAFGEKPTKVGAQNQKHINFLCDDCYFSIKLNKTLFCPICRARLADNKRICHSDSPFLLAAAGDYSNPILQSLIYCFKYERLENLAPFLGELLIKYLVENCKLKINGLIAVPVPLHSQRRRERGFNQAELLTKFIAKKLNLELVDGLKRIKNTSPQSRLKNSENRLKNVSGCFRIKADAAEKIKKRNIILVDDVFTSGATITEAAKTLKAAGAKKIIALVIAKA